MSAAQKKPDDEPAILHFPSRGEPDGPTVAEIISAYLAEKELLVTLGQYDSKSIVRARHYLGSFRAAFGHIPVAKGGKGQFVQWLLDNPVWQAPDTIGDAIASVVTCFRWATDQSPPLIDKTPYKRFKGLIPTPRVRACITQEEAKAVLKAAKSRGYKNSRLSFRFAIYFLFETGARTCELRVADWSQVDWSKGLIAMEKHKTAKVTGDTRLIVLEGLILRMLRWAWRKRGQPRDGNIFLNGRGEPLKCGSFAKYFRQVADSVGIRKEVSAYSLRHGFIVQALEQGVGIRQIADVVGHKDTRQIDRRYGRAARTRVNYLRATMRQARGKRKNQ